MRNYKEEFEKCKEELREVNNLERLFEVWKKAQDIEIDEIDNLLISETSQNSKREKGDIFEHDLYKSKGEKYKNTISSHFVQFFYKDCPKKCKKWQGSKEKPWRHVLKNAFNMDGCVGTFEIGEKGYPYIFLLKEANDSHKVCSGDYEEFALKKERVNVWLVNWKNGEVSARLLDNLYKALKEIKHEDFSKSDFLNIAAYMNVNKRGGTVQTQGYDITAVINYAEKYRAFIMKEICLFAGENQEVTVFVAGKRGKYFQRLMKALGAEQINQYYAKQMDGNKKIRFVNITHPSKPGMTGESLAEEMKMV